MIHVILAEDHHLVRQGIRALLEKAHDIEIVAEAENGEEAVQAAQRLNPDVLITDINMPRLNGIQATEKLHRLGLDTRVVILSMHSNKSLVRQSLQQGVKGYLLKSSVKDELLIAVRAAARNATYLSPAISELVAADYALDQPLSDTEAGYESLTAREREILKLIAEGYTNKAIGEAMHLSIKTVEKDRARLNDKLQARDLVALIRIAMRHGLILPED